MMVRWRGRKKRGGEGKVSEEGWLILIQILVQTVIKD